MPRARSSPSRSIVAIAFTSVLVVAATVGVALAAGSVRSGTPIRTPTVVARTIVVQDPEAGRLVFDALAAGEPAAARHGRLVLLLHGFPATAESYRVILPRIAAAGFYAVAPDQRGYSPGARPTNISAYGMTSLVSDTLSMATALGARRFHLVGHDWGGGVAWVTASLFPGRVSSLMALSTPSPDALDDAFSVPGSGQSARSSYMTFFRSPTSQQVLLAGGSAGLAAGLEQQGLPARYAVAYARALGTDTALGAALDWYRANPVPNGIRLAPVIVPTVYVWGDKDFAFSRVAVDGTAKTVHAPYRLVVLHGKGHWLPETATDRVTTLLLQQLHNTG